MWKGSVYYRMILDDISYTTTTNKPFRDDFGSHKVKDKWENDNDIAKAALLGHM